MEGEPKLHLTRGFHELELKNNTNSFTFYLTKTNYTLTYTTFFIIIKISQTWLACEYISFMRP